MQPEAGEIIMERVTSAVVNNTANVQQAKAQGKAGMVKNNLDKDSFLKLLVTELRHQDPTQPMQDKEFIAQMAQFSALEQMTNVNTSIQDLNRSVKSGEAYSLLGKKVQALNPLNGRIIEGMVSAIFYKNNDIRLMVNDSEIGLADIHSVYPADGAENKDAAPAGINLNPDAAKAKEVINDISKAAQ